MKCNAHLPDNGLLGIDTCNAHAKSSNEAGTVVCWLSFKSVLNPSWGSEPKHWFTTYGLSYWFIRIITLGEKLEIPLLQYSMASIIHPIGASHFQVKDAGHLPKQPAVRRMMSRSCINLWPDPGGCVNNTSAYNEECKADIRSWSKTFAS